MCHASTQSFHGCSPTIASCARLRLRAPTGLVRDGVLSIVAVFGVLVVFAVYAGMHFKLRPRVGTRWA